MKANTYLIGMMLVLSALIVLLNACGGGEQATEEETVQTEEATTQDVQDPILTMDLNSVSSIEDWLALIAIKLNENAFPVSEQVMITRNDLEYESRIINPDGRVQIIRMGHPSWENMEEGLRYLTRDGEVVLLEDLEKTADGYQINAIYYGDGKILEGRSRMGATIQEARNAVPKPYEPTAEEDLRINYEELKSRSDALIEEIKSKAG